MNDSFGTSNAGGFDTSVGQGSGVVTESKPEGIVPMVIKQIHDCPESGLRLYDMVFGTVQIVAIIRGVEHSSTKITYVLDDHTGRIDGHTWLEEGDQSDKSPHIVVNTYAKIFGSVRNQGGTKTLIIFKIEPVTNPNEVTTHLLEVLNARFSAEQYATKKKTEVEGEGRMETDRVQNNGDMHPTGLIGKELAVYQAIQQNVSEAGISFSELERKFSHIPSSELRTIVEFMTQEGMCYTSVDANHFKSSDDGNN